MFDFLSDKPAEPLVPEVVYHGPNAKSMKKMTRKQVIQDFLDVYAENDMGKSIMRTHMANDPKSFFDVVKKMIPNNYGLEGGESLKVNIIDRYGNAIQIESSATEEDGTPNRDLTSPGNPGGSPEVSIQDTFGSNPRPIKQIATSSSPEFDFTL